MPFESKDDNDDCSELYNYFRSKNYIENLSIFSHKEDRTIWEEANKRKREKVIHLKDDMNKSEQVNSEIFNACMFNLNKLLKKYPGIEEAIGPSLYFQIKEMNANNKRHLLHLFNKITSIIDQYEIFEDNIK